MVVPSVVGFSLPNQLKTRNFLINHNPVTAVLRLYRPSQLAVHAYVHLLFPFLYVRLKLYADSAATNLCSVAFSFADVKKYVRAL